MQRNNIINVYIHIHTYAHGDSNIYWNKRVHSCASHLLNAVISLLAARVAILLDNGETCCLLKLPLKGINKHQGHTTLGWYFFITPIEFNHFSIEYNFIFHVPLYSCNTCLHFLYTSGVSHTSSHHAR